MKSVLVAMEQTPLMPPVLESAHRVAERFRSYVEGVAVRTEPAEVGPIAEVYAAGRLPPARRQGPQFAQQAREQFETFMEARSVPRGDTETSVKKTEYTCGWRAGDPLSDGDVAIYARAFDLAVFARHDLGNILDRENACQAALFESGRPVLIAPPSLPRTFGEAVLIHWNGSAETARTIALAMPILAKARRVFVLTLEGGTLVSRARPGSGEQLAGHLALSGIDVEHRSVHLDRQGPGETILAEAASVDCDLLVKGAYTQSRFRQMIFGGATRHILEKSQLPVFMAH